jgi:NADH-quinone oxidoreductase subunit M
MLVLYRKLFFGKLEKADVKAMADLNWKEVVVFAPLIVLVFWLGIYPATFKDPIASSVASIVSAHQARTTPKAAEVK